MMPLCVYWGILGRERLPGFTDLEQTCQALIEAFDGSKKIPSPGGSAGHFMGVQIRSQRLAELGGAADTLVGEQGAYGCSIPLVGLALLQFLKCPSSLAYIIDGVAKLARIHSTRPDGLLQFQQVVDCPLQPERHAPKSLAGRKKLDGQSQHPALFGGTQGNHSRRGCFSCAKVSQLNKAADGRAASHVEQPTVHVDFFGFSKLDDACAVGLQPLHLHGNGYRVTVTPPVFSLCDRYLGARLVRCQQPPPLVRAPHPPGSL